VLTLVIPLYCCLCYLLFPCVAFAAVFYVCCETSSRVVDVLFSQDILLMCIFLLNLAVLVPSITLSVNLGNFVTRND
jgi:hypothetical protein